MSAEVDPNKKKTLWNTYQSKIWNFLNNPNASLASKTFGFISLFFVILSIFSFIAGTTAPFQFYETTSITGNTSDAASFNFTANFNFTAMNESTRNISKTVEVSQEIVMQAKHPSLHIIDIVCLVFFTVEYILRLIFAPKKLQFITSIMGAIDLVAILPDYIEMVVYGANPDITQDSHVVAFITIFRIVRVLRIFRLIKHVPGLWILVYTLKASIGELVLLTCFMSVGILVFSSVIYFVEERDDFESIPHAFWWALITMTTVGYGDMYPRTMLGKLVGSICAMSGLLMIGFSVPALVNNFMLYYKHMQFALQADKEKATKDDEEHSARKHSYTTTDDDGSTKEDLASRKNTLTDDNDNKQEGVPLVTIHVNNEQGKETIYTI